VLTDEQVEAAVAALSEPERFQGAERRLAQLAPQLQQVLAQALHEGGWFGEAHESQLREAAAAGEAAERMTMIRTLLAEETRMGMLVGVAVGWELAREIDAKGV
jgi:Lon protease-like protein